MAEGGGADGGSSPFYSHRARPEAGGEELGRHLSQASRMRAMGACATLGSQPSVLGALKF